MIACGGRYEGAEEEKDSLNTVYINYEQCVLMDYKK